MARGAELAVDARRGQLAEQVFIQVALGVACGERQVVDHVDRLYQKAGLLDHQLRILHEFGERGADGRLAEMREDPVAHQRQHLVGTQMAELRPAEFLFIGIEPALELGTAALQAVFVASFVHVEQAHEDQEGDLLDHRQRIGDAAGPELGPEGIDLLFQFAGYH